ncbi:MAG: TolC family outer membrane protein [Burkholderiales bacterium]|nr:TolC family outer membrane protein [Burkholderiales bacterium]
MKNTVLGASLITLACCSAMAQSTAVTGAAKKAVETNPEVAAKFNAFRASISEVDISRGAMLPRVDLSADVGANEDRIAGRTPSADQSMSRTGMALTATQLLWDGMTTSKDVSRANHQKMARYFDFVDATEQTALEAARAHYDVQRYRTLVLLAEQNYVQHKYAVDQIQSRVKAGVARGVDLEQSSARLALAESNLVTERANLHDVTERYRRIVGDTPPGKLGNESPYKRPLPASGSSALESTPLTSPIIASAIENLRATKEQAAGRKGSYQPRIEARLRAGVGNNMDGVQNQKRDVLGQLVLNWNLYNGGADDARQRLAANQINQAMDLRDKACRDTRQTVAIAYNDVSKLGEQLAYLDRNVVAIERARDAYRQQFDIGQRSLLDLLNAENELYTAKRSYAMALYDLDVAKARTFAGMGTLMSALGLARDDARELAPEADNWNAGDDAVGRCPLTATGTGGTSREDLDARARSLAVPAPTAAAPVAVALAVPAAPRPAEAQSPATVAEQRLRDWAQSWMSKDLNRYYSFYGDAFGPLKANKAKWMADRKRLVTKPGDISVVLEDIKAQTVSPTRAETTFRQIYKSSNFSDQMVKTLTWDRVGSDWVIVRESNR